MLDPSERLRNLKEDGNRQEPERFENVRVQSVLTPNEMPEVLLPPDVRPDRLS